MTVSDNNLLMQFEDLSLPPAEINHLSHLRIAWLYLVKLGLNAAVEKITSGTKKIAEHHGEYEKYSRTVTEAIARIMAQRMRDHKVLGFETFVEQNRDLVDDSKALLGEYYSENRLFSDRARLEFLEPDRRGFC